MIGFEGQVAIVTGAWRGLGRAYARELARRGAVVSARRQIDRDPAGLAGWLAEWLKQQHSPMGNGSSQLPAMSPLKTG